LCGIVFDFLSQVCDVDAQVVGCLAGLRPPYISKELTMSEDFTHVGDEQPEQGILGWRKFDDFAAFANNAPGQIDFQVPGTEHCVSALAMSMSQNCNRASSSPALNGLSHSRWHCVERGDFIVLTIANTENDEGTSPIPRRRLRTVIPSNRQAKVEQYDIRATLSCLHDALIASVASKTRYHSRRATAAGDESAVHHQ
jgi:hypothetical protein